MLLNSENFCEIRYTLISILFSGLSSIKGDAPGGELTNQSSSTIEGMEDTDSKGASSTCGGPGGTSTRLTRSRANASEQGSDSPRDLSQCENANLEPPTKETSLGPGSGASASASSNPNVNQLNR